VSVFVVSVANNHTGYVWSVLGAIDWYITNTTSTTEVLVNNKKNWSFRKRQPSTAIITDLVPGSYHWILAKHKSTGTGVATNKTTTNIELTAIAICTTAIAHLV
jgi:hypothetical protein